MRWRVKKSGINQISGWDGLSHKTTIEKPVAQGAAKLRVHREIRII